MRDRGPLPKPYARRRKQRASDGQVVIVAHATMPLPP